MSLAVEAPSLVVLDGGPWTAFGLGGRYGTPALIWQAGAVVVRGVRDADDLDHLRIIATRLAAELVDGEGKVVH